MAEKAYLAIDLVRPEDAILIGRFDGEKLRLEEVHRFENGPVEMNGRMYWDLPGLWSRVRQGLSAARAADGGEAIVSIGVDTWGVDFGLLGRGDELLGNPVSLSRQPHRRHAGTGLRHRAARRNLSRNRHAVHADQHALSTAGHAAGNSPLLDVAESLLMMPDLFHWLLTGVSATK